VSTHSALPLRQLLPFSAVHQYTHWSLYKCALEACNFFPLAASRFAAIMGEGLWMMRQANTAWRAIRRGANLRVVIPRGLPG
jgi:hypothetical protein